MLEENIKKSVFKLYEDELDIESFSEYEVMLKTFIMYKYKVPVDSYIYKDEKFKVIKCSKDDEPIDKDKLKNCFVIGGQQIYRPQYIDEVITGFININIEADSDNQYSIYIDEENRVVHLYRAGKNGLELFNSYTERVMCSIITRLFPWYFKDIPDDVKKTIAPMFIDNEKMDLFELEFEAVINEQGIVAKILQDKMLNMGEQIMHRKTEALKKREESEKASIAENINKIFESNNAIKQIQKEIMMIELGADELKNPIQEIIEFIKFTKEDINIVDVTNNQIIFEMRTVLDQYSKEAFDTHLNNKRSYWYENLFLEDTYTHDEIRDLYYNILTPGTGYKVWSSSRINLSIIDVMVSTGHTTLKNSMPHPHLNGSLSCFGTASTIIAEYVMENRFVEALNQILYASKQYTIPDGAGPNFVSGIQHYSCIECPDGNYRNAEDTLIYMRKVKEAEKNDRC